MRFNKYIDVRNLSLVRQIRPLMSLNLWECLWLFMTECIQIAQTIRCLENIIWYTFPKERISGLECEPLTVMSGAEMSSKI